MGFGGISPWQLLILLAIVIAIFGTKKLRNLGGDLGTAMRDFRGAMRDNEKDDDAEKSEDDEDQRVVDQQDGASTQARSTSEADTRETVSESGQKKH